MTDITKERLLEIIAGCEGVTPGPWDEAAGLVRAIDGDAAIPIFETREPWKKHRRASTVVHQEWHNRHHVARLDPATVKAMAELALQALNGVEVKPLEWKPLHGYGADAEQASGILPGLYAVFIDDDSAAGAVFAEWALGPDDFCTTSAKTLGRFFGWGEAKAAAQTDYERRIRSALQPAQGVGVKGRDWSSEQEREAVKAGERAAYEYTGGRIGVFLAGLTAYRKSLTAALQPNEVV